MAKYWKAIKAKSIKAGDRLLLQGVPVLVLTTEINSTGTASPRIRVSLRRSPAYSLIPSEFTKNFGLEDEVSKEDG